MANALFQVFTTAATDDHKSIVLLAFETIEKVVREYFPYITETETTTFTDCVNCLIAFTNSRFNQDVSLNAIAFLRFCALKLAEGELGAAERNKVKDKSLKSDPPFTDKDDHLYFWFPLLVGEFIIISLVHFLVSLYTTYSNTKIDQNTLGELNVYV